MNSLFRLVESRFKRIQSFNIWLILVLVILLFSSHNSQAQNFNQGTNLNTVPDSIQAALDASELREFRRNRLSIVVEIEGSENINVTGMEYSAIAGVITTKKEITRSIDQYKRWIPYRGFEKINEPKFFEIVGYPELHKETEEYHNKVKKEPTRVEGVIKLTSLLGVAVGLGVANSKNVSDQNKKTGLIIAGSSVGGFLLGLALPNVREEKVDRYFNKIPLSQVKGISEEYNQQLFQKLKK